MTLLSWIPFLEALPVHGGAWWLLLAPLIFGICAAYKATRCEDMSRCAAQTTRMTLHVLLIMALLWAGLLVITRVVIPALPV